MGAGRAPPTGKTPAAQAAAERPVLHAKTPAAQKTREGYFPHHPYQVCALLVAIVVILNSECVFLQEMEQMHRYNQRLMEEMKSKQTQERTRLPKIQRSDAKTRMAMFKKSLRITTTGVTPELERERVKQVRGHIRFRLKVAVSDF